MAGNDTKTGPICIYCGGAVTKERKGEHLVPHAIGGELTLKEIAGKSVCPRCNNGVLSVLDTALCRRSFLSIVASQELAASLWQVWDVDHASRDLLIEARPEWREGKLESLVSYPQMIFEAAGPQIRGDVTEAEKFGREQFKNVMIRAVHGAFERYNRGKNGALHFERVRNDLKTRNYRLPPRVFTTHTITEIANNIRDQSFIFRYLSPEDVRFALLSMSRLEIGNKNMFNQLSYHIGSQVPSISIHFNLVRTIRAMMKIGVNLLAAYCSKTPVNCESYRSVIRLILGKSHPHQAMLVTRNGFVRADGIQEIAHPGCHSFRLTYLDNRWLFYASFFGGRIGSAVSIPGPNHEDWNTMDILAPIHSKLWTINTTKLFRPMKVCVEWSDNTAICPSLQWQYADSSLVVREVPAEES